MAHSFAIQARLHKDPAAVQSKMARLEEPHIKPLTELARRISVERGADVPLFDPASGGTRAQVLLLLESPGPASATQRGSGLISMDNNDQTAANGFQGLIDAGLGRSATLNWNIVPWYLASVRKPSEDEVSAARPYLLDLLDFLPELRVVVLLGKAAQDGWAAQRPSSVRAINAPHPSPQNFNTRPHNRVLFLDALREAASLVS